MCSLQFHGIGANSSTSITGMDDTRAYGWLKHQNVVNTDANHHQYYHYQRLEFVFKEFC